MRNRHTTVSAWHQAVWEGDHPKLSSQYARGKDCRLRIFVQIRRLEPLMNLKNRIQANVTECLWTQAELVVQAIFAPILVLAAPLVHVIYYFGGFAKFNRRRVRTKYNAYLITGAGQGIGAALAVRLAKSSATRGLYLVGRAALRMDDTRRACCSVAASPDLDIVILEADVQDRAAMKRAVLQADQAERDAGRVGLTCVVANAGVSSSLVDPAYSLGFSSAATIMSTNMMGTIHTLEPVVDLFAARGCGQIVIVSSASSFFSAVPFVTVYGASKAAQRVFGESLRATLEPYGVDVLTVCPGFVRTRMTASRTSQGPQIHGGAVYGFGMVTAQETARDVADAMEQRGVGVLVTPSWWRLASRIFSLFPYQLRAIFGRSLRTAGTECFIAPH